MSRIWYAEHAGATRFAPSLPPGAMLTYNISQPNETHFREASCVEVDCFHSKAGWRTVVDTDTVLGARQANYIRLQSGRRYTFEQNGSLVTFSFPGGQECFATHRVPLERPATFRRAPGDFRGLTGDVRTFTGRNAAADWVDDFANNQLKIAEAVNRG